jgi:MOSC domain-containing protein YiiM
MIQGLLLQNSYSTKGQQQPTGAPSWKPIGSIQSLYCRTAKEPEPRRLMKAEAMANYGIIGDRHACPHSPRQLLIAGTPAYERFGLDDATLRENIRIDFSTTDLRSGDLLLLGADVVLWLTFHCEPCTLLERRHPGTVPIIGKHRGMLARVLRGGVFCVGDAVSLTRASLPAMSDDWQTRVIGVACAVPAGHYIAYRQLAEMAGVAKAYCRAFPKVLSRLPAEVSSRVIGAASSLPGPQWSGAELFDVAHHLDCDLPCRLSSVQNV